MPSSQRTNGPPGENGRTNRTKTREDGWRFSGEAKEDFFCSCSGSRALFGCRQTSSDGCNTSNAGNSFPARWLPSLGRKLGCAFPRRQAANTRAASKLDNTGQIRRDKRQSCVTGKQEPCRTGLFPPRLEPGAPAALTGESRLPRTEKNAIYGARATAGRLLVLLCGCRAFAPGLNGFTARSSQSPSEYQIKAAFLYNFTQFVDWPPEAFASPDAPMIIGLLGERMYLAMISRTPSMAAIINGQQLPAGAIQGISFGRPPPPTATFFSSARRRKEPSLENPRGQLRGSSVS